MNFHQMHERLRQEMLRRIKRGTLNVSLLARQTSLAPAHMSNFLHARRELSLDAADRVLAAQHLSVSDLLPAGRIPGGGFLEADERVPVVSQSAAAFEPHIRPEGALFLVHCPAGLLESIRPRPTVPRRAWQRFVAVKVTAEDAEPMRPVLEPGTVALLDRHYNSLVPYRGDRPNLYAVRRGAHLTLRYVDFVADRLVLRPHRLSFPVELIELRPGEAPGDLLAGRVAMTMNEP